MTSASAPLFGDGWRREADPNGLPTWTGTESIVNYKRLEDPKTDHSAFCRILTAIALFFASLLVTYLIGITFFKGQIFMLAVVAAVSIGGVFVLPLLKMGYVHKPKFFGGSWALVAHADSLEYRKMTRSRVLGNHDEKWRIALDQIARVESGRTVEWQGAREIIAPPKREMILVPDVEYQVFIFTTDGLRLVVHTANAAREDCGRLAHSIRAYIEQVRSTSPAPTFASSSAADGFDL